VGLGFFPLDEELQLLPGSLTPTLHEYLVRLGAWMPFEKAGQLLADFMRLSSVSEPTARRQTQAAGAAYVALQTQTVAQLEKTAPLPTVAPAKLGIEVDGAMVPLVGGEWAEVKTVILGEVSPPEVVKGEKHVRLTALSSFSRMADCDTFDRLALVETHRRGLERAGQVGAISDGAEWIQGFLDFHCPSARRILDFPHAGEHVAVIGQGLYGEGTPENTAWFNDTLHRLKHEGGTTVLAELRPLVAACPEQAELGRALAYLEKREAQLAYPTFQAENWPIGSGAVESANKLVVEARLKGAGMRWAPEQVNPMLALRNIVCSDRWDEDWPQMATHLRQQAAQGRRARQQQRLGRSRPKPDIDTSAQALQANEPSVAEPLPITTQAAKSFTVAEPGVVRAPYRPASNHPWRHSPIGRARFQPASVVSQPKL